MSEATPNNNVISYHYKFTFPSGISKEFNIRLDHKTLKMLPPERETYPEWTKLENDQCTDCPLDSKKQERCPIAANLTDVIDFFKDVISYEEADIEITTANRVYKKHTAVQYGLSSMIGLFMVTSGCPAMDKLRPLVATHLPFSNSEEATYRAISMYLFAQYYRMKNGQNPDWTLQNLIPTYADIQKVNTGFNKRIGRVHTQDAGLNAVFHLNCQAQFTNFFLLESELDDIKRLFEGFLKEDASGGNEQKAA